MMKQFFSLILAGCVGGAVAFGLMNTFQKEVKIYSGVEQKIVPVKSVTTSPRIVDNLSFADASAIATPTVVHISAKNKAFVNYNQQGRRNLIDEFYYYSRPNKDRPLAGTGSGVIISSDGYIVTNNHVVGYADFIEVTTHDGKKYSATRIGTDKSTDLAVLKIEGQNLDYIKFSNSDKVRVGEWVLAVGNPFNLTSTVTAGIISAKGRELNIIDESKSIEEFIQTDAVVNPGNSGGALANVNGELIGINTAISSPTGVYAGYSFAIPSNLVKKVVEDIKQNGDIERTNLGVYVQDVGYLNKEGADLPSNIGVYVDSFTRGSSAYYAGIEKGDIIVGVDEEKIVGFEDLKRSLKFVKVGDTLSVSILRDGKRKNIPVKLRKGI